MSTLTRAMIDTARRVRVEATGEWIEGQRATAETTGEPFACLLTVSATDETETGDQYRARLLYGPAVELDPEDRVQVTSSALGDALWQVDGPPAVVRRSRRVVAHEANLLRVEGA